MYKPQALHTGSPSALRRHSVVVVVWQLAQDRPTRREADCNTGDRPFKSKVKAGAATPISRGVLRGWALPTWVVGAGQKNPVGASQTSGSSRASLYLTQPWGGVGAGETCCGRRRVNPNCGFNGVISHSTSDGNPSGHWAL